MTSMVTYGGLPALSMTAPDGAQAIVALYGAHLLSWKSAGGQERLFVSARSALDGSKAIRGGVPVIFPQFAERGAGQRHGFARLSNWRLGASGEEGSSAWAEFHLNQSDLAPSVVQAWPHAFELRLRLTVSDAALDIEFNVHNSGAQNFPFAAALHTYYAVEEFARATLEGLPQQPLLHFSDKLDQIHAAKTATALTLHGPGIALRLEQQGFSQWVVWNPGAADAAALNDMEDEEYRRFVCIEPARVDQQVLAAGAGWTGRHRIASVAV